MDVNKARAEFKRWAKEHGLKDPEMDRRRTGRSTALALMILGWVIQNPQKWARIVNHDVPGIRDTYQMDSLLEQQIKDIVKTLDLKNIVFGRDPKRPTHIKIKYDLTPWEDL